MKKFIKKLTAFFEVSKFKSSFKVEVFAGFVSFLSMSYILIVNPNSILWNGVADARWSSVFIATAIGAFIGTILMALLAKMPLALAPGMGTNAIVGGIIGGAYGFTFSYGNAMLLVFISGVIFLLLSIIPSGKVVNGKNISLRELIFEGIPTNIIKAIPIGIGFYIAFIGFQNAGLISSNDVSLVQLIDFSDKSGWVLGGANCKAIVALFGLIVITVLSHFNVKGSVLIGIICATILSLPLGVTSFDYLLGRVNGITWKFWENFGTFFSKESSDGGIFLSLFKEGFSMPSGSFITCFMLVITYSLVDLFDTIGTVVGCCANANLIDKDGKPHNYDKIMQTDSISTCTGALLGSSAVTIFVESATGISEGGRTGLTALVCSILFILSIFLLPVFAFIPSAAASSALIYVGALMIKNVTEVDFTNIRNAIPAFLTIIIMPLSYSITDGIGIGIVSYVIIELFIYSYEYIKYKKNKSNKPVFNISIISLIVFILFLIYFLVPTIF